VFVLVSKDNVRMMLSLPKKLKIRLEALAEADNRSLNNFIVTILKGVVEKPNKK
jgi:predicted HicB family RNase H-like nuclease